MLILEYYMNNDALLTAYGNKKIKHLVDLQILQAHTLYGFVLWFVIVYYLKTCRTTYTECTMHNPLRTASFCLGMDSTSCPKRSTRMPARVVSSWLDVLWVVDHC
jgi:hypothetical protein